MTTDVSMLDRVPERWREEFARYMESGESQDKEFLRFLDTDPVGTALVDELIRTEMEEIRRMVCTQKKII